MSSPLTRLGATAEKPDANPTVVELDDERAQVVLDALRSDTARALVSAVHDDPAPPSELACRLDTSVQNVHYHLSKLAAAGVVESVGTCYSEKGNEMTIYGPAADPIVLVGSTTPSERADLRRSLLDWAAGVAALGLTSVAVQVGAERFVGGAGTDFFEPASRGVSDPGGIVHFGLTVAEPGTLFFVGGLVVFLVAALRNRGVFSSFDLDH
ncbi:MAG: ArsR/SmtB family transcription factor [Halobacteriota archaeon]